MVEVSNECFHYENSVLHAQLVISPHYDRSNGEGVENSLMPRDIVSL